MVFDVLITGSILYTGREIIKDGYVYIKNGKIIDYGQSPVSEDYTYVNLILGGSGRIIVPSLTAVIDAAAYPLRLSSPSLKERVEFYGKIPPSEAVTLSLPAVYEAHMAGIGHVIIEYTSLELPNTLRSLIGGKYGLAYPSCVGKPPGEPPSVITVYGEGCGESGQVEVRDGSGYVSGERVLALFNRATYSRLEGDPLTESNRLREAIGLKPATIEKNERAEIAVYNASRPPGMFLDKAGEDVIRRIYVSGARLETLMVGDAILVDQGEHLYIVEKHFSEARKAGLRILERR